MKVIASTRPNRPVLHGVDAVRLNGAFIMEKEYHVISELYNQTPIFFDVPTKREKVVVSDITQDTIVNVLWARHNDMGVRNIIAISKVESVDDLINVKPNILCAKIESIKGVNNLDKFIDKVDMICIDRVDLISEVGLFKYVEFEKLAINIAKQAGKEIIIASNILPTLIKSQSPTIPEIAQLHHYKDIGVDYVILAEETAVGFYPYQAIDIIRRIV